MNDNLTVKDCYLALYRSLHRAADRGEDQDAELDSHIDAIMLLAQETREIFLKEPPLLQLVPKITICGWLFLLLFCSFLIILL
jgi:hypothetical protein